MMNQLPILRTPNSSKKPSLWRQETLSPPKSPQTLVSTVASCSNTAYQHLCTVFTLPGHFFTMVTYKDQTWTYDGIFGEQQGGDRLLWQSGDEYVCGATSNFGRNAMAYVHAYGLETEAEEVEDAELDDVETETCSKPLDDPDSGDEGNQDGSDGKGNGEPNSDLTMGDGQSDVKDKSSGRGSPGSHLRRSKRKSGESGRKLSYNLRSKH